MSSIKEKLSDWAYEYVPGPIYRIPRRIEDFLYSIKWFFQKIIRKHHTSDVELWNLHSHLAKFIYPKLKAFKEEKRQSYPSVFSEYCEHEWENKEEYNKAIKDGDLIGGGLEKWEEILDEMIFAFEYFLHDEDEKYVKDFYKKWGLNDPQEKLQKNLSVSYWYDLPDGMRMMTGEPLSEEELKERGCTFRKKDSMYYNVKLDHKHGMRAKKGFELFGKYFMNLWD